ncbi:hypothetical protein HPB50_013389 [Hyalomma asiaticum]|uniref:Uncharacterized protein n=1 Tax=Hyalomma asiaticum TaxID=266040 RepID=A0ACB7RKH9_HYAAI|nr:hypothetical protein HPB50_013389 [Hyalomma asiaticum]
MPGLRRRQPDSDENADKCMIVKECEALLSRLTSQHQLVALDTEGVNLGPQGPLTLVQLATPVGEVFLFDVQSAPQLFTEGHLRDILEAEHITKVMHDCRNDSAALFFQFGIKLQNVFDTQAAHAALQQQDVGKPVHKVKNVSLGTLCSLYGGPANPRRDQASALHVSQKPPGRMKLICSSAMCKNLPVYTPGVS